PLACGLNGPAKIRFRFGLIALTEPQESAVGIGERMARINFKRLVVIGQGPLPIAFCQASIAPVVICRCDAKIKFDGSGKVAYSSSEVSAVRARVASTQIRDGQVRIDLQSFVVMGNGVEQFVLLRQDVA